MEFEIKEKREYKDEASGKSFANYKFFYAGRTYWIGQKAFEKNAKLLKIENNKIVLKEPLKEFYELKIRKNEKGEFKTILPKNEIEAEKSIAKEPEVSYETKAKKLKKSVKNPRNQEIEGFFNLPLPKTIDKKESISKTETSLKEPKQPQKTKEQSRQAFISGLIPHIKTADNKVKDRYFDLLSKEMERMPQMEERIMRELGEMKERIGGKTRGKDKSENQEYKAETKKNKFDFSKLNHNPKFTSDLLKKFKYKRDDSGFKFLVHKPNDEETFSLKDFEEIVKKSENYFDELKKSDCLHPALYTNTSELIKLMADEGKSAVEKTKRHPFDNIECDKIVKEKASKVYKNITNNGKTLFISWIIKNFKKNYRFANETSEATILKDLIVNVFNQNNKCHLDSERKKAFVFNDYRNMELLDSNSDINEIHKISINFEEKFELLAFFFTWVPNIKYALSVMADDILKHCNYNGKRDFQNNMKEVFCSINKKFIDIKEHTELLLTINDKNTISNTNPDKLLNDYKDKLLNSLKGICDWYIHYDLENGDSYIVQFLPELPLDETIKKHSEKAGGFKHLFTFYD